MYIQTERERKKRTGGKKKMRRMWLTMVNALGRYLPTTRSCM